MDESPRTIVIDGEKLDDLIDRIKAVSVFAGTLAFLAVFWTVTLHLIGIV